MKPSNRWTCSTISPRAGISVIIRLKREGMKHERPKMEIPQDLLGETRQVRDEKVTELCNGLAKLFNEVLNDG